MTSDLGHMHKNYSKALKCRLLTFRRKNTTKSYSPSKRNPKQNL